MDKISIIKNLGINLILFNYNSLNFSKGTNSHFALIQI